MVKLFSSVLWFRLDAFQHRPTQKTTEKEWGVINFNFSTKKCVEPETTWDINYRIPKKPVRLPTNNSRDILHDLYKTIQLMNLIKLILKVIKDKAIDRHYKEVAHNAWFACKNAHTFHLPCTRSSYRNICEIFRQLYLSLWIFVTTYLIFYQM